MSNVVSLFQTKTPSVQETDDDDVTGIIMYITDWAEERGVDIYNDLAFHIRVADLMAQLKLLAKNVKYAASV